MHIKYINPLPKNLGDLLLKYDNKIVGSHGDIGTLSFYPAHHITMGEGGAVLTNRGKLRLLVESFRDWGRDCFCDPGKENTCGKRFAWQLGNLPKGYDHKYTYSHLGYNLKITDIQAACGLAQLRRVKEFIKTRIDSLLRSDLLLYRDNIFFSNIAIFHFGDHFQFLKISTNR